jgi:ABC-type glycerol-3-phosphate transport system substrate-binding protein
MYKKLLVLLLCGAMLIAMLASCVNANEGEDSSTAANEEETNWVSADLEHSDAYKGKELVILSNKDDDIGPEENSSDPLEDAVYRRNDKIESVYGIEINGLHVEDYITLGQDVKTDVTAGTGEYHIVYQHMVDAATNLALGNNLYKLNDLEHVDFDQPWWDQDCKNGFMIGDSMLLVCGDLLPSTNTITAAVIFNKNLFDEYGLEYPYDDARQGTWTIDDMLILTKDRTKDLNGDGKVVYQDDFYGLVGWSLDCDFNFFFGAGCTLFSFDEDHLPVYNANTDRLQTVYDKIYELIVTQQSFHVTVDEYIANKSMYAEPAGVFKSGRALMYASYLSGAIGLKDMENDFGLLPQPKYDEKQENYLSFVNGSASVVVVPKSVSEENLDMAGYMMEVLSSSSYYMVTETLYEKVAKSKTARDPESAEMVDIIIRNKVFDFGYTHFHHKSLACASIVQTSLNSKSPSIVKNITKDEKLTKKELKKILEAYGY